MVKRKIWNIYKSDSEIQQKLLKELQISPTLAMLLVNRGFCDSQKALNFLEPKLESLQSPFAINNLEYAVDKIEKAINKNKKILIFGDYDVDGITSTALLMEILKMLQAQVEFYIPDRMEEGYGLNKEALTEHYHKGFELIITVDCGISAWEEITYGRELGLDFIVTDHHQPPAELPPCLIINPVLEHQDVPWKDLSGVGVAFKLAHGLLIRYLGEETAFKKIITILDLAALGTIADIVPLHNENRILVKYGLKHISDNGRIGIKALCETAGLDINSLSSSGIGFFLAPRLNACGRIGNASLGVQLLLSNNYLEAREIANSLNKENQNRQSIEGQILKEAIDLVESLELHKEKVIVLAGEGWHQGVIGIVASRLLEKYSRPTIILTLQNDIYKGSGRSIPGFHLQKALAQCQDLLESFGGHSQAAGLSISKSNLPDFKKQINFLANEIITDEDFIQSIDIDGEINLENANFHLLEEIKKLEPFGCGNPEPTLIYRGGEITDYKEVGSNGGHLKLKIKAGNSYWDGIGFNMASKLEIAASQEPLDLAFNLDKNSWNGKTSLQLILKDMKPYKMLDNPSNPPDFLERMFLFGQDFAEETALLSQNKQEWREDSTEGQNADSILSQLDNLELKAKIKSAIIGAAEYLPKQLETLESLFEGNSTLAVLGQGKTAVYQTIAAFLALSSQKTTIIICPIRALVDNYYNNFKAKLLSLGLNVAHATGSLEMEERLNLFSGVGMGRIDIVLTTPEFFCFYKSEFLSLVNKIGLIAFDDCHHLVFQRNNCSKLLPQILPDFAQTRCLAVTNAADENTTEIIVKTLGIEKVIVDYSTRENLRIIDVRGFNDKIGYIKKIIFTNKRTVVYVNNNKTAYSLAADLRKDLPLYKEKLGYYHNALTSSDQQEVTRLFREGALQLVVATSSFGERGIGINDIENVILYDLVYSREEFIHLMGGAGGNGYRNQIHLLYGVKDREINRFLLAGNAPQREQLVKFYLFLKKLSNRNNPLKMTDEELNQWTNIYKISGPQVQAIGIWLGIFEELGLIDLKLSGDRREIYIKNNPPKVDLESSVRYLEGHEAKTNFEEFVEAACRAKGEDLVRLINGAIYP